MLTVTLFPGSSVAAKFSYAIPVDADEIAEYWASGQADKNPCCVAARGKRRCTRPATGAYLLCGHHRKANYKKGEYRTECYEPVPVA